MQFYSGATGQVGRFSEGFCLRRVQLATGATEIAIHEMGHTAFGLADEYPYYAGGAETGHDHHPAGEPGEPNVTINTNRATLKWRWAVAPTTAIPTMSNPTCGTVDSRPSPVPAGHGRAVRRRALLPLRRLPTRVRLQDAQPWRAVLPGLPAGHLEPDQPAGDHAGARKDADHAWWRAIPSISTCSPSPPTAAR